MYFIVKFAKRVAQHLQIIILLRLGLVTFSFPLGEGEPETSSGFLVIGAGGRVHGSRFFSVIVGLPMHFSKHQEISHHYET